MKDSYFEGYVHGEHEIVNILAQEVDDPYINNRITLTYSNGIMEYTIVLLDYFCEDLYIRKEYYSSDGYSTITRINEFSLHYKCELDEIDVGFVGSSDDSEGCVVLEYSRPPLQKEIAERKRVFEELKQEANKQRLEKEHKLFLKLKEKYEPSNLPPTT